MSHEITVNAIDADIELDSGIIWENIEDSVNDAARNAVSDYAWDEVVGEVEEMIHHEVAGSLGSEAVEETVTELLSNYSSSKERDESPCFTGAAFEKAVGHAVASSDAVVSRSASNADEALAVQKRLADLEHQVKTLLSSIADMGERAASVTPNSVV